MTNRGKKSISKSVKTLTVLLVTFLMIGTFTGKVYADDGPAVSSGTNLEDISYDNFNSDIALPSKKLTLSSHEDIESFDGYKK